MFSIAQNVQHFLGVAQLLLGLISEPRYEISLGKDGEGREESDAVHRAGKVHCGRRGWEGAFLSDAELFAIELLNCGNVFHSQQKY